MASPQLDEAAIFNAARKLDAPERVAEAAAETEHGGELETSLMLHLAPERVRADQIADFVPEGEDPRRYIRARMPTPPPGSQGAVGRPSRATAEKGRLIYERYRVALRTALTRSG